MDEPRADLRRALLQQSHAGLFIERLGLWPRLDCGFPDYARDRKEGADAGRQALCDVFFDVVERLSIRLVHLRDESLHTCGPRELCR